VWCELARHLGTTLAGAKRLVPSSEFPTWYAYYRGDARGADKVCDYLAALRTDIRAAFSGRAVPLADGYLVLQRPAPEAEAMGGKVYWSQFFNALRRRFGKEEENVGTDP
jgi:hypothetical protein